MNIIQAPAMLFTGDAERTFYNPNGVLTIGIPPGRPTPGTNLPSISTSVMSTKIPQLPSRSLGKITLSIPSSNSVRARVRTISTTLM
jgi:hypothetical protein